MPSRRSRWLIVATTLAAVSCGVLGRHISHRVAKPDEPTSPERDAAVADAGPGYPTLDGTPPDRITRENEESGTATWKLDKPALSHEVEGYVSLASAQAGDTVQVHVTVDHSRPVHYELYRMGYYQGLGARLIKTESARTIDPQPACPANPTSGLVECDWTPAFDVTIDQDWVTGEYMFKLITEDGTASYAPLVVRESSPHAAVIFQAAVTTWQAYNTYGGSSLYRNSLPAELGFKRPHADAVSFDRPYTCQDLTADDCVPGEGNYELGERWMIAWLEQHGIELSYVTNLDLLGGADPAGDPETDTATGNHELLHSRILFMSVGHDEYWSLGERQVLEDARTAGVSLAFFSANVGYWRIRVGPSSRGEPRRVITCYKDMRDPQGNSPSTTTEWRNDPSPRPEHSLIGVMYDDKASRTWLDGFAPVVTNASHWIYAGTGVQDGDILGFNIGYEWDHAFNSNVPPGRELVAHAELFNVHGTPLPWDASVSYPTPHSIVFGGGSIYWANALAKPNYTDERIMRMTENVLARAGVTGFDFTTPPPRAAAPAQPEIVTLAGTGVDGDSDGPVDQAQLGAPVGLALGDAGEIYFTDAEYNRVKMIKDGNVTTFAGCGKHEVTNGHGTDACFKTPLGLARAQDGTLYVADGDGNCIRAISPSGDVTTYAGTGKVGTDDDPDRMAAKFSMPRGLALAADGTLYVADNDSSNVRRIDGAGVKTIGGLSEPTGLTLGPDGSLYAIATRGATLHRYHGDSWTDLAGSFSRFGDADGASGDARLRPADGIALDGDRLVFTDSANHKLRQLDLRTGYVTTIAGSGVSAHDLQMPRGVLVTSDGYIVADTGNHRIVHVARRY